MHTVSYTLKLKQTNDTDTQVASKEPKDDYVYAVVNKSSKWLLYYRLTCSCVFYNYRQGHQPVAERVKESEFPAHATINSYITLASCTSLRYSIFVTTSILVFVLNWTPTKLPPIATKVCLVMLRHFNSTKGSSPSLMTSVGMHWSLATTHSVRVTFITQKQNLGFGMQLASYSIPIVLHGVGVLVRLLQDVTCSAVAGDASCISVNGKSSN